MRLISEDALAIGEIWREAENQPLEGKIGIGEVIRNRERLLYSSDGTVEGTVALAKQFSSWNDDRRDNARLIASLRIDTVDPHVQDCSMAWTKSLTSNLTDGAVLYFNPKTTPGGKPPWDFSKLVQTVQIKDHIFFKLKEQPAATPPAGDAPQAQEG